MTPEIAIVGGGPAGLALAAILERNNMDYVVYERSVENSHPHGGCLDLHVGSGQRAMQEAGVFDEFKKSSRDGDATIHLLYNHEGDKLLSWGEGRDAPEIDRWQLRRVLLLAIPKDKIVWSKTVTGAARDENGRVILSFRDGTTASGFKLVVGADGTFSKIRHLVTPAKPTFSGQIYITTKIHPTNPFYDAMQSMCRMGSMVIMGRRRHMFNSRQGDGHYRIDIGIQGTEDLAISAFGDLTDHEAVKKFLLQDDYFGRYAPQFQDIIKYSEGPFRPWLMYYMPTEFLNWTSATGVTLIGDAAHVTTPFVGDGVNCAMRDSVILAHKLKEFGVTQKAIAEYEKEMFPYAIDVITRSIKSGEMFFEEDSPKTFLQTMQSGSPLIGASDGH
ncbi:Monooxygenase [Pleurostoma richardsiae]|uniref:Monooxygenase n=1 Tax=Pleurostoma richardsiae TaxID=41990 RepID=A0AA38VL42_9PEZI|nr:Monooxygenase [Pleurostoma richardsiae]